MGAIIVAVGAASLTVIPVWFLICWLFKQDRVRTVLGCVLGVLVIFLAGYYFQTLLAWTEEYGFDVAPSEVPMVELPSNATDVSYYYIYGPSPLTADFQISEEEFVEWMKRFDGPIEPIVDAITVYEVDASFEGYRKAREVKTGCQWDSYDDSSNDDTGMSIVFDQQQSRVYVRVTMW